MSKITIRFIGEEVEDMTFDRILPVGTTVRIDENDSDWFVEKIVVLVYEGDVIIFVSRTPNKL